jgi:outer membrane protein OmpA-like peptidoglycan-associated protein
MEDHIMRRFSICCAAAAVFGLAASAQTTADPQPIYRVTVVSRTLQAVNYEHRGGPTMIDFNGTVLLPHAKGQAIVESKRGRVSIDAKLERLEAPTMFGTEYLAYVLWAISPEGRAKNLGEVLVDSSNKAHITVTADLQAFGMIVTAEPYYSVATPSDVVVMENVVRPDTIGMREVVSARYDLLPRGGYVLNLAPNQRVAMASEGRKLPYDQYEALLEVYQAENAVQIARSMGADRFAPESLNKALALLDNARQMQSHTQDSHMVVSLAREAAQTAEDARAIAVKRRDEQQQREVQHSQDEGRIRAEQDAQQARVQAGQLAAQERAPVEAEAQQARVLTAPQVVEPDQEVQPQQPLPPVTARPVERAKFELSGDQRKTRAEILARLTPMLDTRDTPRGLVVTVNDPLFESETSDALRPAATERLMRIAAIVKAHPDLVIRVEGFTDDREHSRELSQRRADGVRIALTRYGVAPGSVVSMGYGNSRPLESNATAAGRETNRRVELDIAGPCIGDMALWDRTYSLKR